MTRIRASKPSDRRAWALLLLGLPAVACAARVSAVQVPMLGHSAENPPRRPDAVVVEPPAAMPSAVSRADARGVVALREPLAGDAVGNLVSAFLDAWQHESIEALTALLTADAGPIEARARGKNPLVEGWRQRLHAHPYGRLAGVELARPERIERWEAEDLAAADAPPRPPDMRPGELYIRVPLEVSRVAGEKFFGDVIVMLVRREEGKYRIAAYGEIDTL